MTKSSPAASHFVVHRYCLFETFMRADLQYTLILSPPVYKELEVGNDQEMAQSERNSQSINRGVGIN